MLLINVLHTRTIQVQVVVTMRTAASTTGTTVFLALLVYTDVQFPSFSPHASLLLSYSFAHSFAIYFWL